MLLIYTLFSSNAPPRTLYCDDSSLWVVTPACICTSFSTLFPDAPFIFFRSLVFSSCVCVVWIFCPFTFISSITLSLCITIWRFCFPRGLRNTRFLVLYPTIEKLTTTLSAEWSCIENSPFRLVIVTFPCFNTDTVASSRGAMFSSMTRPFNVKDCAAAITAQYISIANNKILFIKIKTLFFAFYFNSSLVFSNSW